jgi:hypothetical protein
MMRRSLLAFALAFTAAACTEELDNDVGCPALCPQEQVNIQTVTIEPVVLDTTVQSLIAPGSDPLMLLASRGDTLDARVVVRFDTIPAEFRPVGSANLQPITTIRDARLDLRTFTTRAKLADPTTIDVFNVDTTAGDLDFAALLPLFRPDRRIGGGTFTPTQLTSRDSLRIPLDGDALLPIIQSAQRLRVGLRVSGATGVQFHILASESGAAVQPVLSFRPSADTTVARLVFSPLSGSPPDQVDLRLDLADYVIFARTPPQGSPATLNVGGLPAQRIYLRFAIPSSIVDSATVIRATLLLTQRPNRTFAGTDTLTVLVQLALGTSAITDVRRAAHLVSDPEIVEPLFTVPGDSGVRSLDIAPYLQFWATVDPDETPHAIVLTAAGENATPLETWFFSTAAAPELRPRLRISYARRTAGGLP